MRIALRNTGPPWNRRAIATGLFVLALVLPTFVTASAHAQSGAPSPQTNGLLVPDADSPGSRPTARLEPTGANDADAFGVLVRAAVLDANRHSLTAALLVKVNGGSGGTDLRPPALTNNVAPSWGRIRARDSPDDGFGGEADARAPPLADHVRYWAPRDHLVTDCR